MPKAKKIKDEAIFQIKRHAGSTMSDCRGNTVYESIPNQENVGHYSTDPERIIGRVLGEGTVIKVTVEIVKEKPLAMRCINPWGDHRSPRHKKVVAAGLKATQYLERYR